MGLGSPLPRWRCPRTSDPHLTPIYTIYTIYTKYTIYNIHLTPIYTLLEENTKMTNKHLPCVLACLERWRDKETGRHVLADKMPPSVRILSASCEGGLCAQIPRFLCLLPGPVASAAFCLFCLCRSYRTSIFPSMATLLPPLGEKRNATKYTFNLKSGLFTFSFVLFVRSGRVTHSRVPSWV